MKDEAIASVIVMMAIKGDDEKAKATHQSIESIENKMRDKILDEISEIQAIRGDVAGAIETATAQSPLASTDFVLNRIDQVRAYLGNFSGAEGAAYQIQRHQSQPNIAKTLSSVLKARIAYGDILGAATMSKGFANGDAVDKTLLSMQFGEKLVALIHDRDPNVAMHLDGQTHFLDDLLDSE